MIGVEVTIAYLLFGSVLSQTTQSYALQQTGRPIAPHGIVAITLFWPLFLAHYIITVLREEK